MSGLFPATCVKILFRVLPVDLDAISLAGGAGQILVPVGCFVHSRLKKSVVANIEEHSFF